MRPKLKDMPGWLVEQSAIALIGMAAFIGIIACDVTITMMEFKKVLKKFWGKK